jgi:hypothetical protein
VGAADLALCRLQLDLPKQGSEQPRWMPGAPTRRSARWGSTLGLVEGGHGRHALDGPPWSDTVFGNLETWLRGTFHGVSPKHLQRYLNEFVFRFNQRWQEADLFFPVLRCAIAADPLPYDHLTAEEAG